MKNIILTGFISIFSLVSFGQTTIADNDTICDCSNSTSSFNDGSVINFQDAQGASDYLANANDTITFCPDAGASKLLATFAIDQGFSWNVDGSDTLYVYDGPDTSSPLIGAYNSVTNPNGLSVQSSWNNPSGCLTFVFISDGTNEGTGWDANVSCGNPPQPYDIHMEAFINGQANGANDVLNDLNPADTGYLDVCLGDSIMFIAHPNFPNDPSVTGNGGYDQVNTHTVTWEATDGFSATGDTVWYTPSSQSGFLITLTVADTFPQEQSIMCIVRVSTTPSFTTCTALSDTVCEGQVTQLFGGVTPGDTVGVDPTQGSVEIGGTFATLTYLPDGSGQNYTTDIQISGFPAGTTLQSASDLNRICLKMEHSYLGDLEMMLTCPNGQNVMIFNSYTGNGLYPGGFGGGGDFVGGANDNGNGSPGVCEEYCFSELPGALPAWVNGYNTVPATGPSTGDMVEPNTYLPEESFATALAGCPINGTWTITVRDNMGIDDGYICEWGIFFDATLNPNSETYTPYIVNDFWSTNPTIITGVNDTAVIVQPNLGTNSYTFNVVAIPGPSIINPTSGCVGDPAGVQFTNTYAPEGGIWVFPNELTPKFANTFINQGFTSNTPGTYTVYFMDNQCGDTISQDITFLPLPTADIIPESETICRGDAITVNVNSSDPNNAVWTLDTTIVGTGSNIIIDTPGIYVASVTNSCGTASDQLELFLEDCVIPNIISPNGDGQNDVFYTNIAETYSDVHFTVFNRWGRKVYETENYNNTWNGVDNGGKDLAEGTYYYVFTYNNADKTMTGFITIVR